MQKYPRVLLLGALPPPIGGISLHVKRMIFDDRNEEVVALLDIRQRKIVTKGGEYSSLFEVFQFLSKCEIVHIHISSALKVLVCLIARLLGKKVIYTHHNEQQLGWVRTGLTIIFCSTTIFVNEKSLRFYSNGRLYKRKKMVRIPAYIAGSGYEDIPASLKRGIHGYRQVLVSNCYRKNLLNGEEVYGFDLILEAYQYLAKTMDHECTAVLVLLDPSNEYRSDLIEFFAGHQSDSWKVIYVGGKDVSYTALLTYATVSIRATRTDGDSLSVRESLSKGVSCVASDAVKRPNGVIQFASGDYRSLAGALKEAILKGPSMSESLGADYFEDIMGIYNST